MNSQPRSKSSASPFFFDSSSIHTAPDSVLRQT
jgi:hypothetical protein